MKKKVILLTGASGNMGKEGLKQLHKHSDQYHIVLLALPTPQDRNLLQPYLKDPSVSIIWGDLTNAADVNKAVAGVDIVLHLGALVSPQADHQPELAWEVNVGGTKHLVDAILQRPDRDAVRLLYIGSVAQTGNRIPPYHWGRVGDPLLPSVYDHYALSKIAAERYVIESGLKHWVSFRQTALLHDDILAVDDGIGYHQPLGNALEWVTAPDSGRLLLNFCGDKVPQSLWRKVYNIGGGASCRLTAYQFLEKVYEMLGVDFRKLMRPNWFALRNFHGHYFYDSDKLEELLPFRSESVDAALARIRLRLPFKMKLMKYLPSSLLKKGMKKNALQGDTPLNWIKNDQKDKIKAFLGSREKWEQIPDWDQWEEQKALPPRKLDHGYDESKTDAQLDWGDLQQAAEFRGGKCLSTRMEQCDLYAKRKFVCAHGHEFAASPFAVLKAGHWCEACLQPPWNFDEQAKRNPFIAQIWHADQIF